MELKRRNSLVYGLLVAVWVLVAGWQIEEHVRVRKSARAALINRAKDKSDTLALVMRSQRRFGGVISKERMEAALNELIRPGELNAIALLNADGEVVAAVGEPIDLQRSEEHTSELQSRLHLVCRLLLEKKNNP